MTNNVQIPVSGQHIKFVPETDQAREARVWEDGKPLADRERKVDAKGRPLFEFLALVEMAGTRLGSVRIESPSPLPEQAPLGTLFHGQGAGQLRISNNANGFDLNIRMSIDGFEPVKN